MPIPGSFSFTTGRVILADQARLYFIFSFLLIQASFLLFLYITFFHCKRISVLCYVLHNYELKGLALVQGQGKETHIISNLQTVNSYL